LELGFWDLFVICYLSFVIFLNNENVLVLLIGAWIFGFTAIYFLYFVIFLNCEVVFVLINWRLDFGIYLSFVF